MGVVIVPRNDDGSCEELYMSYRGLSAFVDILEEFHAPLPEWEDDTWIPAEMAKAWSKALEMAMFCMESDPCIAGRELDEYAEWFKACGGCHIV